MYMESFDFEVQHRAGSAHANADSLSRHPCHQCGLDNELTPQSKTGDYRARGVTGQDGQTGKIGHTGQSYRSVIPTPVTDDAGHTEIVDNVDARVNATSNTEDAQFC